MTESAVYVVEKMSHGYKRLGHAAGAGFYDYSEASPQLWSGLKTFERRSRALPDDVVRDRLFHAAMNAAITTSASEGPGDVATILGGGLPADREAAQRWLAANDRATLAARAEALVARFGQRFALPDEL